MKRSAFLPMSSSIRRGNLPTAAIIVIALSVVLGMFLTDTSQEMISYVLVTLVCAAPIALWIKSGALGIPVLPAIAGMYFIYYALPIIRKNVEIQDFGPSEILTGAATVALFLITTTLVWWLIVGRTRKSNDVAPSLISGRWVNRIIFIGFALGISFHVAVYSGIAGWLGPFFGVYRSAMISFTVSACFMAGHAYAFGSLRGRKWVLAVACMSILILLTWLSLFLVGGMMYCLGAVLGYVITSKRIPWRFLSAAVVVTICLHAGKGDMREKYWIKDSNYSARVSVFEMPEMFGEWVGLGLTKIFFGEEYVSAVDRASLFNMLLRVQRLVPDYLPFLDGASYAVLPEMLVPRFLQPDKINSQTAMTMLNVHAGIQTPEDAAKTSIGWGLLAEAYFNFGYLGVIGVAFLFGLVCASLESWTVGAELFSLPCLVAVAALMQLIDIELDLAGLVTATFQSVVSVSIVFWAIKLLWKKKRIAQRAVRQDIASGNWA